MTRALVIGGGVAGTAVALALHKAGLEAVVCEAHRSGADDAGAFLTVGPNGMRALAQIGAAAAVRAAGFRLTSLAMVDEDGREIGTAPLSRPPGDTAGHRHLRRADLHAVLHEQARRRGVAVEHGRRLLDATGGGAGVRARFTDGTTAEGDLLIGADGLRSAVRGLIDPAAAPPRYAGQQVYWGYAPAADRSAAPEVLHLVRGRRARFGYLLSPRGETWWFARVPGPELPRDELAATPPASWRERLVELLGDDRTPAAGIVAATGEQLVADNVYDVPGLRRWHRARMIVIGDAAHAASPAAGQGASMALEDAVILGKCLRDLPDLERAFAAYEQLRRNRVDRVVTESAAMTRPDLPDRTQRARENQQARERYARGVGAPPSWMFDYPLAWDVTVTPELAAATATAQDSRSVGQGRPAVIPRT